ncbi:M99 family carboxypeptidase catalytic domain-containing protein [Sulfurospirillum sp. 1307]
MSLGMLRLFSILLVLKALVFADGFDFTLIKKGNIDDNNTLLVVGGIQGDEPGGFMAASLLSTHYEIKKGSVWIVPNFNFYSIIKRSRAPYGDLNRKFANLSPDDHDFHLIDRMKKIITKDNIKMVINLHDGSGYYRPKYIDKWRNPSRWGQATIIDQAKVDGIKYGNLEEIANKVDDYINQKLIKKDHMFHTKNTKTHLKKTYEEKEMSKTLTFYAIGQGKAAFGNESSKFLPVNERVYYKLLALEKFMDIMGIKYERKFNLNPKELKDVIDNDIYISFNDKRIFIPLSRIRPNITYFPVQKGSKISFKPSSPVMTVIEEDSKFIVYYGNKRLTTLVPEYLEYDKFDGSIKINIDGKVKDVKLGSLIEVKDFFNVGVDKRLRVNVIGYVNKKHKNESGLNIRKKYLLKRFSIDKDSKRYRVEVYDAKNQDKFLGMVLVEFVK